jgi:pimeloyl-[acyl-carrier protein] synthase
MQHFDPGPAFFEDPYPAYRALRAAGGPQWVAQARSVTSEGFLLFGTYEQAVAIFKQAQGVSKNVQAMRPPGAASAFDLHVLHRDGADHLRLRRLIADAFSPGAMAALQPVIDAAARGLARQLRERGGGEFVADFAQPLPLAVLAAFMGLPPGDMPDVRRWCFELCDGFDSLLADATILARQKAALGALLAYIESKLANPGALVPGGLLARLVAAQQREELSRQELIGMTGFLLLAGHETTVSLLGNGLWLLLSNEAQWRRLREQPGLAASAVEEILRYESPEQRTSFRIVREGFDVAGFAVEPGQQLGIAIGSANRDERAFERPDEFDITRTPNRHVAFGVGLHHCLGRSLARVEGVAALRALVELTPEVKLVEPTVRWRRNSFFRTVAALPVTVE